MDKASDKSLSVTRSTETSGISLLDLRRRTPLWARLTPVSKINDQAESDERAFYGVWCVALYPAVALKNYGTRNFQDSLGYGVVYWLVLSTCRILAKIGTFSTE